jgi:hypothetical protein
MRMFVKVTPSTKVMNELATKGRIGEVLERTMARLKPEAAYFGIQSGARTMMFFVDVPEASQMPPLFEGLWGELEANVECTPVMNVAELKTGLGKLKQ